MREQTLREHAYSQAIHDTGARLTHDVKNILQAMKSLLAAVDVSTPEDGERLLALIQRQLPQLVTRLSQTVDKLKQPTEQDEGRVPANDWWQGLRSRYAHDGVNFVPDVVDNNATVPQDLFDSVADNLLTNALRKRQTEPWVVVEAQLSLQPTLVLSVIDTGSPAPDYVARNLFQSPVGSDSGLGVGLYQAARQAARLGFQLGLTENLPGKVEMSLIAMGSRRAMEDTPG